MAAVLAAVSLGLAGSAGASGASSAHMKKTALYNKLPAKVKSAGKIVDYVEPTFPPMEMAGTTGSKLTGIDVELARATAKAIGIKLDIVTVQTFAELFPALTTGRADMVWSGIFDSPTRFKLDTFDDYFKTGTQLYIPKSEAGTYKKPSQLCGHTVAGETATLYQGNLTAAFKKICPAGQNLKFVNLSGIAQQNLAMQQGRAQVAVAGPESVDYLQKTNPGQYQALGKPYDPTYYGVVFAHNAFGKQLEHVVKLGIEKIIKNGTYKNILKHFDVQMQAVSKVTIDKGTTQP
ncbi:MAG TPA: transporter substrate-binding domain-containing protein [Acidimicrobiales bacterium]|nr:transporter substrate-binding domain-containing protein [Acidimicrobiales bacterium]